MTWLGLEAWVHGKIFNQSAVGRFVLKVKGRICTKVRGQDTVKRSVYFTQGRKEMFYLTTHSTLFIYGYMALNIWQKTTRIAREQTCCCHMGYSFRLTARFFLYAPSHRQDSTYSLCYTSHGALAGMRNSSMGRPHEGSIYIHTCT